MRRIELGGRQTEKKTEKKRMCSKGIATTTRFTKEKEEEEVHPSPLLKRVFLSSSTLPFPPRQSSR